MPERTVEAERWLQRIEDLAELRDGVKRLPVGARRILKQGPLEEPACGVCTALDAVNGCISYAEELRDYHEVGVHAMAQAIGAEFFHDLVEQTNDENERLVKALAGALSAERTLTIYLLAGWIPPRMRKRVTRPALPALVETWAVPAVGRGLTDDLVAQAYSTFVVAMQRTGTTRKAIRAALESVWRS